MAWKPSEDQERTLFNYMSRGLDNWMAQCESNEDWTELMDWVYQFLRESGEQRLVDISDQGRRYQTVEILRDRHVLPPKPKRRRRQHA